MHIKRYNAESNSFSVLKDLIIFSEVTIGMDIRQLTLEDFDARAELGMYAFQYRKSTEELEKEKQDFKPERTWGLFEEEQLSAQLTLLPLQTYIHGQVFEMGGIAGVATWPEKRRQGLVAKLLEHTLQQMNEAGQSISFLHPFHFPFYRKFGWETYIEYRKYTIPTNKLPAKVHVEGTIKRGIRDLELLNAIYEKYAAHYNGTLVRDTERWERKLPSGDELFTAVYYNPKDQACGYVIYEIADQKMNIKELVYLDERSRQALWTYIANHDSMVTEVNLQAPINDALPYLLNDPRIEQQVVPYFMARIVNVKHFLEQYPFTVGKVESLSIRVNDSVAEWNNGIWDVLINDEGKAKVSRREALPEGLQQDLWDHSDIDTDIQALTVALIGYKRPLELCSWGKWTGKLEAVYILESRIPVATTHLMDFF